ncbi:hypothetical protein GGS20DRAFT_580368 [Poronia punctata]|nr:hypothetical protein GGS20DRAFT_580368 [Poronia punctata]
MGDKQAVANILSSTRETPVDLNDDPSLHYYDGTVDRMIDFAPNIEPLMHRAVSLDYGIVVEGTFKLILDSGEERIMRQGDPGRMMWVLVDCKDVVVNGKKMEGFLGELD